MSGPAEAAVLAGVLVDAGLKATALVGLGALGARALQRGSAAQRHAVWAATLGALPALLVLAAERGPAVALDAAWIGPVWALGVGVALWPLLTGLIRIASLTARATADVREPGVRWSAEIAGPITWGVVRPVVLLPIEAAAWPPSDRAAALAHERAHVARGDWLVHVLAWAVCALFWFHPLVWLARRGLEREAEHAADDRVLTAGTRPSDYATLMLALAVRPAPRGALGAGSSAVGARVRAVLDGRSRSAQRWPIAALALALAVPGLPAVGAWAAWDPPPPAELTCSPEPLPWDSSPF